MDRKEETRKSWDKIAALYQERFMDLHIYDHTYDALCELLPSSPASLFEIGCGPGNITRYLLEKRPDLKIEAIDNSPNMIALAAGNNPSALFRVMDCREIGTIRHQFHAIVCGFCLPYLSPEETTDLVKDCAQLLFSEGLLYLSFVEGAPSLSGYQTGSNGDRIYFYYHQLAMIQDILKQNGFRQVALFTVNFPKQDGSTEAHTILIAQRLTR